MSKQLPWFRTYTRMVDDDKLKLLAFEDRWHFVALLCLKGEGLLDKGDAPSLLMRKVAVKLGLDVRSLEEVARRLAEVGLIDQATLQPMKWDGLQMRSDTDTTAADRKKRQRERAKEAKAALSNGFEGSHEDVTGESRVTGTDVTRTDIDIDTDTKVDKTEEELVPVGGPGVPPAPRQMPKKAERLSPTWTLRKAWGDWALAERPDLTQDDVRKQAEMFRDHWVAKSGKDATKLDWEATWRNDMQAFAPETGTLGIPRAEMPQVPTQSHGGLVKHLNAKGIAHETTMVDAAQLKPTQAEFSPSKVEAAKTAEGDLFANPRAYAGSAEAALRQVDPSVQFVGDVTAQDERQESGADSKLLFRTDNPAEFARKAVLETQFLYSKANKPQWARGAVGGTLFTFKTYSVSFLELMQRTWNAGEPGSPERAAGRRAVGWAMLMLMLMGGAGGMPFVEDVEDLVDGAGQMMGYNLSAKQWRKDLMREVLGAELAEFMDSGLSGLPGAPIDVSGRLGMGNLIPGTGLLLSKQSSTRDVVEMLGPAGDLVSRGFSGAGDMLSGLVNGDAARMGRGAMEVMPNAVRNAVKGADMAASGIYKDTKGYKVVDTTLDEALWKAIGFQPRSVAQVQESNSFMQRAKSFYTQTSNDIRAQWAKALFEKDESAVVRVRARLAQWNEQNPDQPIRINMPDIWKRAAQMGKDRTARIADTAPTALRQQLRSMAQEESR